MGPLAYLTAVDTSLTHELSPVDRGNDRVSVSLDELTPGLRPLARRAVGCQGKPLQGPLPVRASSGHRRGRPGGIPVHHALQELAGLPH